MSNNLIPRSIGELIDASTNPRLIIPKGDIENAPQPDHAQIRAIGRTLGFSVPKAITAQILALDVKHRNAVTMLERHTSRSALEDFREHSAARDEKIMATQDVSHHTGQTLEDFQRVYREKLVACKRMMARHGQEALELCKPYLQKFADAIREEANNRALWEISRAEAYGFPWKASDAVLRLYRAAQVIEGRIDGFSATSGESPKVSADFIFNLAE